MHKTHALKAGVGSTVVALVVALTGFVAGATPVDPTGGAAGDVQDQSTSWITTQGIPLIVALLVIGIVVSLLVKFARRGARSA